MEWMAEEVSNHDELLEIFKVCDTLHLAINNGQYPYLVPLSYGVEYVDHHIVLYFHGVEEGMKDELFKKNPHVTCSVDIVY
ncbi:MAG: pyridoxamine 5'-phosphate oxidase family protein, partial [Sharpea porci]